MPNGSDPLRRPDQQSSDSGPSVPPSWWGALSDARLPGEITESSPRARWSARLKRIAARLGVPALVVAVVAAVVVISFGQLLVGGAVGAAVVLSLVLVTLWHHRRATASQGSSRWR